MKTHNKILWVVIVIVIIAFIVLPTATPEDAITTLPILATIGWRNFLILCLVILTILLILFNMDATKAYAKEAVNKLTKS